MPINEEQLTDALLRALIGGTLDRRPKDPAGFPIDVNRPVIANPLTGGLESTEFTRTVPIGDRDFNIPSISNGRFVPPDMARFEAGLRNERQPLGLSEVPNFQESPNFAEAIRNAILRSQAIGPARERFGR